MSEMPVCKLCGCDARRYGKDGDYDYDCSNDDCAMNIAAFNEQDWRTLMETGYSEEAIRSAMRFALEEARGDDFVPDETETVLRDFLKSLTEKG